MRGGDETDSKKMLTEVIRLSPETKQWNMHVSIDYNDPKALLATFGDKKKSSNQTFSDKHDVNLETLRRELMSLPSSLELATPVVHTTAKILEPATISSDTAEDKAKKEIQEMLQKEQEKLHAFIEYEIEYQAREEEKRQSSCLILSNLPADIDERARCVSLLSKH